MNTGGEAERELGSPERYRAEDVRSLALPVGVDPRLNPDARPSAMQAAVLPEAGFVFEHDDTSTTSGFSPDRRQALGDPALLRCEVGACQPFAWPLHREVELMQESGDVVVVVPNAEPPADQIADPRSGPDPARVPGRLRPRFDQPRERLALRRVESVSRPGRLAGAQHLGTRRVVPPKPLVHRRPHHLELGRDGQHLLAIDVVPHGLATPPGSQVSLLLRLHDQRAELGQLVPRRPFRLDRLARLGRLVLDPDQSHDRLLETDRRNLGRSRSRHNLIDAGGCNLPKRAGHQPRRSCLVTAAQVTERNASEVLIQQGDKKNSLFLILTGTVGVMVNGRGIGTRRSGEHVGEMSMIDPAATRSATVTVLEDSIVAEIDEADFSRIVGDHPVWRKLAKELCNRLRARGEILRQPNEKPRLFLGSAAEALPVIKAIQAGLQFENVVVTTWGDGVFSPGSFTLETLEAQVQNADFALMAFTPDDVTRSRRKQTDSPRDNVVFELGLFMGALGRRRTFVAQQRGAELKMPSDLKGLTTLLYQPGKPEDLRARVAAVHRVSGADEISRRQVTARTMECLSQPGLADATRR